MAISGVGLGMAATGAFVVYVGISNQPPAEALRNVLKGKVTPIPNRSAGRWTVDGQEPTGSVSVSSPWADAGGDLLAASCLKYVGRDYVWGGNFDPPNGGGDCSGLIFRGFHDLGYLTPRLPSYGYLTWNAVKRVPTAVPGCILWYPGHVAVAVGNGKMVEAPTRGIPVRVVTIRKGYIALQPQFAALSKYAYRTPDRGPI